MDNGLFYDKYRIDSARLPGHDYSRDGYYFVTICTYEQEIFFGDVVDGEMVLNDMGKIVANEWQKTEIIRTNVFLDEWIVMPNHLHGILKIDNDGVTTDGGNKIFVGNAPSVETPRRGVSTPNMAHPPNMANTTNVANTTNMKFTTDGANPAVGVDGNTDGAHPADANHATNETNVGGRKPEWKPGVLGAIINQFKGKCTKQIRALQMFNWQTRFYDHIIRDKNSLNKIRQYIINNPGKWDRDRNNKNGLWM